MSEISFYPANELLSAEKLNPQHYKIDYSLRRYFVDEFYTRHVEKLQTKLQVLDVGGHRDVKRGQFNINRYQLDVQYINMQSSKGTDVVGDAANLPYKSDYADLVICGELLEHVLNPRQVLSELHRILKPNGILLITVPFLYRIHADPYDFGRYTDYFWDYALKDAGFKSIVIEKQGLFGSVLFDMLRDYVHREAWTQGFWRKWIIRGVSRLRRYALHWDAKVQVNKHPIYSSYTTGFGIYALKG